MSKRIFIVVLCCLLVFSLAACRCIKKQPNSNTATQSRQDGANQSGQNGNGESGQNGNGESGQNGNGESGQNGNGESGQNNNGESGQNGNGESGQNNNGESGQNGNGESDQNNNGQPTAGTDSQEMTLEQFIADFSGVWIDVESIAHFYDDQYMYSFKIISEEVFSGGVYPGEGDRPAKITGLTVITDGIYELNLLYEAGIYMGDMYEEATATLTVAVLSQDRIEIRYDESVCITYIYGGEDLDDAQIAAGKYVNSQ